MAVLMSEWKQRDEAPETSVVSDNRSQQWKTRIFPALVTFVRVFGDCRLGSHFTVPSEVPWPKQTWGLRLGAGIADYVKTGTYFQQLGRDADRLDALGFSFKLLETPWEQHGAPLLETFSIIHPRTVVPDNFVVPSEAPWQESMWGIKLGKLVRWNCQHMTDIENKWRVQVLRAVEIYQQERGNSNIGEKFVIPSQSPWPSKTWGVDLSRILHRLHTGECYDGHVALARNSVVRLKHLLHQRRDEAWESIFTALKVYSKRFGHCDIRPHFVIPEHLLWPKAVWNLQLGQIIDKMKTTGNFFSCVGRYANRLSKLDFSLALSNVVWEKKAAPLVAAFANLHPQDTIPWGFTIPAKEPWPEYGWGVNLGVIVQWNLSRLEAIERDWRLQVLLANDVYQYENGNKILRDKFVVPSRSPWPYKTWGRELRHILTCVQVGQHYGGHIAISNFHSNEACAGKNEKWKTTIFPALHTFAMVFGHCSVPGGLGKLVSWSCRFSWNNKEEQWKAREMPAKTKLAGEYGYCRVPASFKVPSELPWPKQMWSLRIKIYLRQLNRSGDLFLSGGLHRALTSEKEVGFVFKLATESDIEFGQPESEKYTAEAEQIENAAESFEVESCLGKRPLPDATGPRKEGWVGSYSPEARKKRVQRFLKKRQERVWVREVKYDMRKVFADTRLRVKGRFVTREDEKNMRELLTLA
ncbi:hypothetical protein PI124_g7926 [Phytophthora idaei]|nr:hypothetical protein PI124_g7926 [Phytophthora idaei]